jgi:hypothetical protein
MRFMEVSTLALSPDFSHLRLRYVTDCLIRGPRLLCIHYWVCVFSRPGKLETRFSLGHTMPDGRKHHAKM